MAQENINIDLIIQTAESAKNLGDLKRSMSEVRKALNLLLSFQTNDFLFNVLHDIINEAVLKKKN